MFPRTPTSQSKASLSRLVLEILIQDLASLHVGNIVGAVIFIQEMAIVGRLVLIVGGDIIVVGVVALQLLLLGLHD